MAGSLLAYLFPRIKGSQEDVATLALTYLLSQSNVLCSSFTSLASRQLHIDLSTSLHFSTQVAGEQLERPDIVGTTANGQEKLICEAKFFAALTSNQPCAYLDRLSNQGGLLFICPQARISGLWRQILSLVTSTPVDDYCVDVSGTHMAIISWTELLDSLLLSVDRSAPEMKDDLLQLIGFCREIENTGFMPFSDEDLGADKAISMDRYYMVIDSAAQILLAQKKYPTTKKGLRATALWNGYAQYLKVRNIPIGLVFYRELWKKTTSLESPFWVSLHNEDWKQDEYVLSYLSTLPAQMIEHSSHGLSFIALKAPIGMTLEETATSISDQVMTYIDEFIRFRESLNR